MLESSENSKGGDIQHKIKNQQFFMNQQKPIEETMLMMASSVNRHFLSNCFSGMQI